MVFTYTQLSEHGAYAWKSGYESGKREVNQQEQEFVAIQQQLEGLQTNREHYNRSVQRAELDMREAMNSRDRCDLKIRELTHLLHSKLGSALHAPPSPYYPPTASIAGTGECLRPSF